MVRNVIVTGASRGLGLAITQELAAGDYHVCAVSRRTSAELQVLIDGSAGRVTHLAADLQVTDQIHLLARRARAAGGPIYGLVNNAGLGTDGLLANMHASQIADLITLNVTAPILLTKFAVRAMMSAGEGRVINMASIVASSGSSGLSVYGATKASMVGFTKSLAREVGRLGITVNAVAPGFIETELTQGLDAEARAQVARRAALRRMAEPVDVARMVSFLMGEGGRNITGAVLTVDAGATA